MRTAPAFTLLVALLSLFLLQSCGDQSRQPDPPRQEQQDDDTSDEE